VTQLLPEGEPCLQSLIPGENHVLFSARIKFEKAYSGLQPFAARRETKIENEGLRVNATLLAPSQSIPLPERCDERAVLPV